MKFTYYLDGKEIKPEDLAGKSGKVKIRFDYTNNESRTVNIDGKDLEVKVPFLAASMLMLPGDKFKNVKVSGGKVMADQDQSIVIGTAFPGLADSLELKDYEATKDIDLKDYVEITADVENFELDFTATAISTCGLSDMKDGDLDDVNDVIDGVKEMTDASDELVDAMGQLSTGAGTLQDYLSQYTSGVSQVDAGAQALAEGLSELDEQITTLMGSLSVAGSDDTTAQAVTQIQKDLGILQQELGSVTTLAEYVNTISENVTTAKSELDKINVTDLETEASNQAKEKAKNAVNTAISETEASTKKDVMDRLKETESYKSLTPEQDTAFRLNEFMERRYEFRFNALTNDLEYRQRDSIHFYFKPVDQRVKNSIAMDALQEGIRVWDRDVNRYLSSNRVPLYNPVEDYLCNLGRWDGKDRVRALADLVPCNNPHWRELFYRWFLNMVAHWRGLDKLHSNSTSPLLVGAQGFRKSTYCRIILPPELRFGYTDSLDFKSKRDAELYLGRFMLINIDEFDQVSINQQGFLKHLLQKPVANLRKPYGSSIQEMRRYASFIGTSNQKDLLTDPSGSRRFICIEVTAPIDTNVTINYRQLYAQAMEAIVKGERYWFDDADEAILRETNREFEQMSPVEQLFHCYFRSPEEGEEGEYLSPMQILEHLRSKNRDIKLTASNVNHFGRILRKNNLEYKRTCKGIVYRVEKL